MNVTALLLTAIFPFNLLFGNPHQIIYSPIWPAIRIPTPPPMPTIRPFFTPSSTIKPSPTNLPSSTPSPVPTISPTTTPTKSPTPKLTPIPFLTPTPSPASDLTVYFLKQINNYRHSQGLSSVQSDPYTCNFAAIRAKEISSSFNHDGFSSRLNNKTLPYPSYSYIIENIAMNSNYQNVVSQWINSPRHAANMRADTPYVCVKAYRNYYAYEGWKP